MPDDADTTEENSAYMLEVGLRLNTFNTSKIPVGVPGDCDKCGEASPRLVLGNCCKCRDIYKLG